MLAHGLPKKKKNNANNIYIDDKKKNIHMPKFIYLFG